MRDRRQRGAVYVEFLLVFPPLLLLFLCTLQLALLYVAHLGVQHAAAMATRSAIVVIPDDPVYYDGADKNAFSDPSNCGESPMAKVIELAGALGKSSATIPLDTCPDGPRGAPIRAAALLAMLPYSPSITRFFPNAERWAGGDVSGMIGAALYNMAAVAVTYPTKPGATTYRPTLPRFHPGDDITVRVTYAAHCGIPIARFLLCDRPVSLVTGVDRDLRRREDPFEIARVQRRLKDSKPRVKELREGTMVPALLAVLLFSDERFRLIAAESTLPLQTAPFAYQSELAPRGGRP
ncbi:MAG: hypothetical protein D6689_22020 [Deltaproteobacteria bacterium]|nr:MAG: hypothetical protein D6689_22020 [Deltaproteobacteria bacterium]